MCDPMHYDFNDLNLDFLDTVSSVQENPSEPKNVCVTSKVEANCETQSNILQTVPTDRKKIKIKELAKQIATADFCIERIKTLENERKALQEQLNEFKGNAENIRQLYIQETEERKRLESRAEELSVKCKLLQTEVAAKTLFVDQLESQLDDFNQFPVEYNELLVGYLRLCNKFEEDAVAPLPNTSAIRADKLRQYCKQKSIRIPESVKRSPKKSQKRSCPKTIKKDACTQYEELKAAPTLISSFTQTATPNEMRSQGTQYINTTTTRSTSTSINLIKRTVGTSFPEPTVLKLEDIIGEMRKWNVQPLSPICEPQEVLNSAPITKSIGTCTFICNVHRQVDYVGPNHSLLTSIKRSNSRPPSRVSVKHELITPPPTIPAPAATNVTGFPLDAINFGGSGSSPTTFDDLWHVFGHMVLGLLSGRQREDSVGQNLINHSNNICNQEQFHRWLREIRSNAIQENRKCTESSSSTTGCPDTNQQNIAHTNLPSEYTCKQNKRKHKKSDINRFPSVCADRNSASFQSTEFQSTRISEHHFSQPEIDKCSSEYKYKKPKSHCRSEKIVNEIVKLFPSAGNTDEMKAKIRKLVRKTNKAKKSKKFVDKKKYINEDDKTSILPHKIKNISSQTENDESMRTKIYHAPPERTELEDNLLENKIYHASPERTKVEDNLLENKDNSIGKLFNISKYESQVKKIFPENNESFIYSSEFSENAVDFLIQLGNTKLNENILISQFADDNISSHSNTSLHQIQDSNFATELFVTYSQKPKKQQKLMNVEKTSKFERKNKDNGRSNTKLKAEENGSTKFKPRPQIIYQGAHESCYRALTDCSNNDKDCKKLIKQNVDNSKLEKNLNPLTYVKFSQVDLHWATSESKEYKNYFEEKGFRNEIGLKEIETIPQKWNISKNNGEKDSYLANEQLLEADLYSPHMKHSDYEISYENEVKINESRPHIIYKSMHENTEMSDTYKNERATEDLTKPNIKTDDSLSGLRPSYHNLDPQNRNSQQRDIIRNELESPEHSSQCKISHYDMPECGFRERNLFPETIEMMPQTGSKICDHNYHLSPLQLQNTIYVNDVSEHTLTQPPLDINQHLYIQKQCHQSELIEIEKSVSHQTILYTVGSQESEMIPQSRSSNQENYEGEDQKIYGSPHIDSNKMRIAFEDNLLNPQTEEVHEPSHPIGELIEVNGERPIEVTVHRGSVEEELEISHLGSSREVLIIETTSIEDQISKEDYVIAGNVSNEDIIAGSLSDTVSECNLIIDECEDFKGTKILKNDQVYEAIEISKTDIVSRENEGNTPTTPKRSCAAIEFCTPNKKIQSDGTPDKKSTLLNDNDDSQLFENYLSNILKEVAPRNVSPISIISSSPIKSTPLNDEPPKKRGRKRKSEQSKSVIAASPDIAQPFASKRSERLRIKRSMADSILDSNSTIVRSTLGKYTSKRSYKKKSAITSFKESAEIADNSEKITINPADEELKPEVNLGFFRERTEVLEVNETSIQNKSAKDFEGTEIEKSINDNSVRDTSLDIFNCAKFQHTQDERELKKIVNFENNQNCDNTHQAEGVNTQPLETISPTSDRLTESPSHYNSSTSPTLPFQSKATTIQNTSSLHRSAVELIVLNYNSTTSASRPNSTNLNTSSMPTSTDSPASPVLDCSASLYSAIPDSPASPLFNRRMSCDPDKSPVKIPLELDPRFMAKAKDSLIHKLITNYRQDLYNLIVKSSINKSTNTNHVQISLCQRIKTFLKNKDEADDVDTPAINLIDEMYSITQNLGKILKAIIFTMQEVPRPEEELGCSMAEVPPKYLGKQHRRISFVLRHLQAKKPFLMSELLAQIESALFSFENSANLSVHVVLNLTQLYLLAISIQSPMIKVNPARLFIAKCLYFHNIKAIPMIYEVLCCFPTTLPHREEHTYDRSDALITVIQHILMCTKYDMDKRDLYMRELLSKLRFEYHFEPYKPELTEVLINLIDKIKAGKVENLPYAFALFCKRLPQKKVEEDIIQAQLLPLVHDYYCRLDEAEANVVSIICLLETLSMIIKPFSIETDIDIYLRIFSRFLNATNNPGIQEAAIQAILRCQRFGYVNCFYALQLFKPRHELSAQTKAMLKTFVYRKSAKFWRRVTEAASFFVACSSN